MTIVDALKALCKKMTDVDSASDSIAGVIEDIAENYTPPSPSEDSEEG